MDVRAQGNAHRAGRLDRDPAFAFRPCSERVEPPAVDFAHQVAIAAGTVEKPIDGPVRRHFDLIVVVEISYSDGVANVMLLQPGFDASPGIDLTDVLSTRPVNIGGSTVSQRMWTAPPEGAPPAEGYHGEFTHAVVVDSEGGELLQVVTQIQGLVSAEEKSAIETAFTDVLASFETHHVAGRDSGWERQELYFADRRVAGRLPSDWSLNAIGEEVINISGPGVAGDEIGITLTRVDEAGLDLATTLDAAYDIGSSLMGSHALHLPGAEHRYILLDRPGEGYPGGRNWYWDMRFRSDSPEDTGILFAIAREGSISLVDDMAPTPTPGPDSYPAP